MKPSRKAYSVSELTQKVRAAIEGNIGTVWVEGEVSNLRQQSSGHQYFSLKDANAQLRCVLFKTDAPSVKLRDGVKVQAFGNLSVYEAQGQYQLIVRMVQLCGLGELQARFEELKRKLNAEGLFDPARKKPIPKFPVTIVLVTSPSGAAIRDMLNILGRRAPWVRVLIGPAPVQGMTAGEELAKRVRWLGKASGNQLPKIDTMIIGRGGGSIEDLWCFNDEKLARAIAACPIPVVSAVGHEIDFTISDFVADQRAPTPSAAAELVVPNREELNQYLDQVGNRLTSNVHRTVQHWRKFVDLLARSGAFREPGRVLQDRKLRLDELEMRMREAGKLQLRQARERTASAQRLLELSRPSRQLEMRKERLVSLKQRLHSTAQRRMVQLSDQVSRLEQLLRTLGPDSVLKRGYSLTLTPDGRILRKLEDVQEGDEVVTRLEDGSIHSQVTAKEAEGGEAPAASE